MALISPEVGTSFSLVDPTAEAVVRSAERHIHGNLPDLWVALHYPNQFWTYDWDKTVTTNKILRDTFGKFDPSRYYKDGDTMTLNNLDLLVVKALAGHGQHICSGKDYNLWSLLPYIRERTEYIGNKLHMVNRLPDGRLRTDIHPERGVFFAVSSGNGGASIDAIRGRLLVLKPIPISAWELMAEAAPFLRRSTTKERLEQIGRRITSHTIYDREVDPFVTEGHAHVTRVEHIVDTSPLTDETRYREIAPMFTGPEQEHMSRLQSAVQDFAMFIPELSTKVNFVLDIEGIINDRTPGGLHDLWREKTGVDVQDFDSFLHAFRTLTENWGVTLTFSEAHGIVFVDITAPEVTKGLSARLMKKAYQHDITEQSNAPHPKILSFSMADNNHPEWGNDRYIVYHNRSLLVGIPKNRYPRTDEGYPVYGQDIYGDVDPMIQANTYLRDSLLLGLPPHLRPMFLALINNLEREHDAHTRTANRPVLFL
jgi:hypothetical protein